MRCHLSASSAASPAVPAVAHEPAPVARWGCTFPEDRVTMRRAILCTFCASVGVWCAGASLSALVFGTLREAVVLIGAACVLFGSFVVLFVSRRP